MQISSIKIKCFVEWQCLALILSQEISDGMYSSEEFPLFQGCKENVEPDKVRKWRRDLKNFKKRLKYGTGAGTSSV